MPAALRIGCLIEAWSGSGLPSDAGTAFGNHCRARHGWCRSHGLDTAGEMQVLGPSSGPWSLTSPGGTKRLADLGYSPDDVTWLRIEAQQHVTDTDPTRRTT